MKVILAGYNLDTEVIKELRKGKEVPAATPETISAAYARISRDKRPVDELRAVARREVEKARQSNRKIIFSMGHHSIAEHAVFNFDIMGVSRLAIEELERFRLCSYTEKSQRYQKLENNFVIPEEIKGTEFEKEFVGIIRTQNEFYQRLCEEIEEEDARYITGLATEGQLGLTINARNLELLVRRFASHELKEVQNLGKEMFKAVEKIAPSIILFTEANDFDQKTYPALREYFQGLEGSRREEKGLEGKGEVQLVDYTPEADVKVVASLMHTSTDLPYKECLKKAKAMSLEEKKEVVKTACQHLELYDAVLREFEHVDLTYNLIISAAGFGQLKRHRIATLTYQKYTPRLGVTLPKTIKDREEFMRIVEQTDKVYERINQKLPAVAPYILTNAHRRRVLLKINARELYHMARLREDKAAQWDIRERTSEMVNLAKAVMPLTFLFISGKDQYPKIYQEIFGHPPKVIEVQLPT